MELEEEFKQRAKEVNELSQRPTNDELLQLYALYKQSTEGDVSGTRPGMLDVKGRKKFDAWSQCKGKNKETAMRDYVDLVGQLKMRYGG